MQLFSALQFETGFSGSEAKKAVDPISQAGLELPLLARNSPYVLKSPWYCQQLDDALRRRALKVKLAIIPMRPINDAAESRRRVYAEAQAAGLVPEAHPGTTWLGERHRNQEEALLQQFYEGLMALVRHRVPVKLLNFPRLAQDEAYLFTELQELLEEHGVTRQDFAMAFAETSRPELIHDFGSTLMQQRAIK